MVENNWPVVIIHFFPYQLFPKFPLSSSLAQGTPRAGALLRVDFGNGFVGYADCCPCPGYGQPLSEELALLAQKKLTKLTTRSLYLAKIDALYRQKGKSVFSQFAKIPESQLLITQPLEHEQFLLDSMQYAALSKFKKIKIKVGYHLERESAILKNAFLALKNLDIKIRLDFNHSGNYNSIKKFLGTLADDIKYIDFIEDPFYYQSQEWKELQELFSVKFMLDNKPALFSPQQIKNNSSHGFVIKPAIEDEKDFYSAKDVPIVFTTLMDHPLGQLGALYCAAEFYQAFPEKEEIGGFITHILFEENEFSEYFLPAKPFLFDVQKGFPGTGFGFDNLLEKLAWQQL